MSDITPQAKAAVTVGTVVTIGAIAAAIVGGGLYLVYLDEKQRAKEERRQGYKYTGGTRLFFR